MLSRAVSKYIRVSPYKLRPLADVIRGRSVYEAFACLKTCGMKKVKPMLKTLFSAYSNARQKDSEIDSMDKVFIKEIRIDQGPIVKYFRPGAMGRASEQRKRMCHLEIVLDKRSK
jgi:large subunit ribosomal protein L22